MAREMKVCTITTSNDVAPNASIPLTLIGVEKTPTPCVKKPKTAKTFSQKSAEIFQSVGDDSSTSPSLPGHPCIPLAMLVSSSYQALQWNQITMVMRSVM
jgi:hypothetical protein